MTVNDLPPGPTRRVWPAAWAQAIAWSIHETRSCQRCLCGRRVCEQPRFDEVQAALRAIAALADLGALVDYPPSTTGE